MSDTVGATGTAGRGPGCPWSRDAAAVAGGLGTDVRRGLRGDEAARRLAQFGPNRLEAARPVPAWRKLLSQFADPLVYLLLAADVGGDGGGPA